jgi:flavin-dependent dehydrogenase
MRICVVGLGINGSYVAYKLAQKGHEVVVFEGKSKIGGKACSGLVSKRIWSYIPENSDLILNEIDFVKIHYPKKTVKVNFRPKMLSLDRLALERYLAKLAKDEGVEIRFGNTILGIDGLEGFDRIIGCDGAMSVVRKDLYVSNPNFRLGIYLYKKEKANFNYAETWPTKNGFCWRIPKGDKVEYGCMDSVYWANMEFNKFCSKQGIEEEYVKSHLIPQGLRFSNDDNIFLCGDAAGLTKPWSGGGIIWGFAAADMLVDSFPNVELYNEKLQAFEKRMKLYNKLTKGASYVGNKVSWLIPSKRTIDSDYLFRFLALK